MSSSTSSSSPPSKAKRPGCSIQGPRPQPLIVSAEASRPSEKPRVVAGGDPAPVIVYELTPRVVHARPEEFRAIVQKLTGKQSTATTAAPVPPLPSDSTMTFPDQVAGGRAGETDTAVATAADPLVLALGQQRQPAPPAIGDNSAYISPPSPAAACLLSLSSLFFSSTTMQALQELGVLF